MRAWTLGSVALLLSSCTLPYAAETLSQEAPPPELGRPWWVRGPAGFGAWVGGAVGAVAAVVALPVTYPLSLVAAEPLGYSEQEFLFGPVTMGASAGHFALGAPVDLVDFTFRRAWADQPPPYDYEFTPMKSPVGPGPGEEAEEELPAAETEPAESPPTESEKK